MSAAQAAGWERADSMRRREKNQKGRWKKVCGVTLSALILLLGLSSPVQSLGGLPESIEMTRGQTRALDWGLPLRMELKQEAQSVLLSGDQTLAEATSGMQLSANAAGIAQLSLSLLGWPIKSIDVNVCESRVLIPGGQLIGVKLHTSGVLVVGMSNLSGTNENPAKSAGVRAGDVITMYAGETVVDSQHLTELVRLHGGADVDMQVMREQKLLTLHVRAIKDTLDGEYHLGVWVRDSTAGVGTLSFYDPESGTYGALGHAVTDVDTGEFLTVREGEVLEAEVVGVVRGQKGEPGEIKGSFLKENRTFGDIAINNQFGIYGSCETAVKNSLYPEGLPVATQKSVHEGAASILCSVDGEGVQEYAVEIVRCQTQREAAQKGMIIRVTDRRLLEKTGGIVQGMSGSTILQDGCIVGCVTHVYVNDPTQGYGMYIEWMLEQTQTAA